MTIRMGETAEAGARLYAEAESFIRSCYGELNKTGRETEERLREIASELTSRGTYELTFEEAAHGARMAWRNANKCIGRLFWNRLHVFDARECKTEEEVYQALLRHIEYGTNGGEIRPTITLFPPAKGGAEPVRIWNHQLIRYAGYETANGVVGDPASIAFTRACMELGWQGEGTPFDVLPLVIQLTGRQPRWFPIPESAVLRVPLTHPDIDLFRGFRAEWYAVPILSDMALEIGGIRFPAAPFNGWYMGTEIGARNLADEFRYDWLPRIAANMGLDTSSNASLWKDRALVELNAAVLHSFRQAGVSIVDHHTAAQQFKMFQRNEAKEERDVTGRWSWLIPPLSPALTDIFHSSFDDTIVMPGFLQQERPYPG